MLPLVLTSLRIACRSDHNSKYLSCVHDKSKGGNHIEASAERVPGNARTRFWVELYDEEKGLVRVRCGYNHKYWKPQEIAGHGWILGTADESDEQLTLFKPEAYKDNSIRFYHTGLRKYACVADEKETYLQLKDQEHIKGDDGHRPDTFTVIGLKYLKDMPQYVLIKGDNDRYLRPKRYMPTFYTGNPDVDEQGLRELPIFLQFGQQDRSDRQPDTNALHVVTTNHDGLVRIKCGGNGKYWRHRSDFIVADSEQDNFDDLNTVFKVHYEDGITALQNMGNNKFCKRLSSYGDDPHNSFTGHYKENCLSAATEVGSVQEAKLQVEEPIIKREISDIRFHIDEARRYSWVTSEDTDSHPNTNDKIEPVKISFRREVRRESKWETSVTVQTREELKTSLGIDAEIGLPYLKDAKVVLGFKWDKSTFNEKTTYKAEANSVTVVQERTISRTFDVNPKTLLRTVVVGTKHSCDVPFSYKQTDALQLGKEVQLPPITHDDGLYTFSTWEYTIKGMPEPLNEDTSMQGS